MPRSSAQSDFVVVRHTAEVVEVEVELPRQARVVQLPRAVLRSNEATTFATKWVMRFTWLVLAALAVLCAVGPHIPSGE